MSGVAWGTGNFDKVVGFDGWGYMTLCAVAGLVSLWRVSVLGAATRGVCVAAVHLQSGADLRLPAVAAVSCHLHAAYEPGVAGPCNSSDQGTFGCWLQSGCSRGLTCAVCFDPVRLLQVHPLAG